MPTPTKKTQEMWANAHEARDSINLIWYAGFLGLSPVISAKIHSKCASQPETAKNLLKTHILPVRGRSRSWMLVTRKARQQCLWYAGRLTVSICNRSLARFVDSSIIRMFWRGYPNLMPYYEALIEPKGSKLALWKSTFNADNFMCRLYLSISSDFGAVHSWNVSGSLKSRQN